MSAEEPRAYLPVFLSVWFLLTSFLRTASPITEPDEQKRVKSRAEIQLECDAMNAERKFACEPLLWCCMPCWLPPLLCTSACLLLLKSFLQLTSSHFRRHVVSPSKFHTRDDCGTSHRFARSRSQTHMLTAFALSSEDADLSALI